MADFLRRQSVITSGFVEILNPHRMPARLAGSGDPRLGPYFSAADGSFELPEGYQPNFTWMSEPSMLSIPEGTKISPQFRAASRLEEDDRGPRGGLPEGFWRWGFHDPSIDTPLNPGIFANAERPNEKNFPLNPLTAGDASLKKWDQRFLPAANATRDYWAYYYNRQVSEYSERIEDMTDPNFLGQFVGPHETFGPADVRYFNWRFIMKNNVDLSAPISPSLDSFAVVYRFEKR